MLEFVGCRFLRIEDVRIENASGWTLRPINCDDVVILGITIKNPVIGPNTDGIDPTVCRNLFISDCHIDTGVDAICLRVRTRTAASRGSLAISPSRIACSPAAATA
jgi:polygalacturonase